MSGTAGNFGDLKFRVLGPIEVTIDGALVPSGGAKQLSLLGRLLLSPGRIVSVDQLTDAVWGSAPPARPDVSIRSSVSKWRKLLSAGESEDASRSVLVTNAPGYRLNILADQVDAVRFERDLHEARDLHRKQPEAAGRILESALREWRGDAFAGCKTDVFVSASARLGELRSSAQDLRVQCLIDSGNVRLAVADLEQLVADEELRESRCALAMQALSLDGRQSEALALFQQFRHRLIESTGIDPSPSIVALERKILDQDPSLQPRREAIIKPVESSEAEIDPPPGRKAEADVLLDAIGQLADGRGSTTLITGEPGIGKTTLARHAAATCPSHISLAWGRCIHGGAAAVLGPWTQVLRDLCEGYEHDEIMAWVSTSAELGQLLPALSLGSDGRPSEDRLDLFDAVTRFLRRRSATRPLVLIFEDVHWADAATVELLSFAAGALSDEPVSFIVTWRDTDLLSAPVIALQELGRAPRCSRVELEGLPTAVIEGLLTASTIDRSAASTSEIAAAVFDRTSGNPLFVTELLGLLADSSPDESSSATSVATLPLTTGIQDAIQRRVEAVGPDATDILSVLAVVDDFASINLVEKVVSASEPMSRRAIEEVLAAAHQAGLVVEHRDDPGAIRLHHALVVETLTESLIGFRRARLHADVGQALWEEGASSAVLAHHFTEGATAGTGALGAAFSLEASAAAGALYDLPRALELLEGGLTALRSNKPVDLALECDILIAMSQIHKQAGDYDLVHDAAQAAFGAAKELGDVSRMVDAAQSYTDRSAKGAIFERVEWLGYWHPAETAVEMLEFTVGKLAHDHPARVELLALLGSARFGSEQDIDRSRREFVAAVELGRDIGSPRLLSALSMRVEFESCYGTSSVVNQILEEIVAYAPTHNAVHDLIQAHRIQAILAADRGSDDQVRAQVALAHSVAESYDNDLARLQAAWVDSAWLLYRGDLVAAEEAIVSGMGVFAKFGLAAVDAFGLQYAGLRREQGQQDEVEQLLRFKLESYDGPAFRGSLAMVLAEAGRVEEAQDLIDQELGPGFETYGEPALQMQTPACWSIAAALSGHKAAAERLFPVFDQPNARLVSLNHGMLHFGSSSFFAGLLAMTLDDVGAAEKHLREAETFERAIGARPSLLRVLCRKQVLLDRLGRETAETAREAEALAETLNMGWLLDIYR